MLQSVLMTIIALFVAALNAVFANIFVTLACVFVTSMLIFAITAFVFIVRENKEAC